MAGKDPDDERGTAALTAELLDYAQLRLAQQIWAEVEGFNRDSDDGAQASAEKRAKTLVVLGRAIAVARQAGGKPPPPAAPPPPANENQDMTNADHAATDDGEGADGLDALSHAELRAHVQARLERFARQFETKHLPLLAERERAEGLRKGVAGAVRTRPASRSA